MKLMRKHKFEGKWDSTEKGYYCMICGVLKKEHAIFEPAIETVALPQDNVAMGNRTPGQSPLYFAGDQI